MSKLTKSWLDKKEQPFDSSMLKIGEMMEVTQVGHACGHILLGTYGGFISLTSPDNTWVTFAPYRKYSGRKLQPGESITLTQE